MKKRAETRLHKQWEAHEYWDSKWTSFTWYCPVAGRVVRRWIPKELRPMLRDAYRYGKMAQMRANYRLIKKLTEVSDE